MLNDFSGQPWLFYSLVGMIGLCVGSLLNVVNYRLPIMLVRDWQQQCHELFPNTCPLPTGRSINLWLPRSFCPECQAPLKWWHNIPLLSFLILRGRCKFCEELISWQYPLVELATLFVSLLVAYHFGASVRTIYLLIFSWTLISIAVIDWQHLIIPDQLSLGLIWLGLLVNSIDFYILPTEAVFGAVLGYGILWVIAQLYTLVRRQEGLGQGDMKLLAAIGAWFGWEGVLVILMLGAILAIVGGGYMLWRQKRHLLQHPIPFGPYLILSTFIYMFYGHNLLAWYYAHLQLATV